MNKEKKEILDLIDNVKNKNDNISFLKLINIYEKIFYKEAHRIMFGEDFEQEKNIILSQAISEYDCNKALFSTFLTNKIRFFLLRKINNIKTDPKISYKDSISDYDFVNANLYQDNEIYDNKYENNLLIDLVKYKISELDKKAQKIFELRYFTNEPLGWREIGKELNCSGQQALNIFNKAIKEIRKDIPNEYIKD